MFHVKTNGRVTYLRRGNIFTYCHECDKEFSVDLSRMAERFPQNLLDMMMLCEECGEKYRHHYPDKTPPTLETLKYLASTLISRGYLKDVAFVFNSGEFTNLEELEECDYAEIASEFLDIFAGTLDERYGMKGSGCNGQTE